MTERWMIVRNGDVLVAGDEGDDVATFPAFDVCEAFAERETTHEIGPSGEPPVFTIGGEWTRHSWYLRLPGPPGGPRAGIVRCEAPAELVRDEVVALADVSAAVLPRYASEAHKDSRAPQNLYPIAGLERDLRHRLGDPALVLRSLRVAAAGGAGDGRGG